ncbi:unnamed protein product [marine sediment metagenome]|uniref:Uncharacterized protein n=1 Tax=marine sediment metagenome TaxID=412755 RepID=X1JHF3_9ZZZZ
MASARNDFLQRIFDKRSLWVELRDYLSAFDGDDGLGGAARLDEQED